MDPRKFLKRLARELGLLRSDPPPTEQKVSEPANFQHRVHVALDDNSGAFVGLPPQWKQIVAKTKPDEVSSHENARFAPGKTDFTQRRRRATSDDHAFVHAYSRTSKDNFSSFAASLETPRSRASVADSQDLIIERLKRELRDYKARNPHGFNESTEDVFHSSNKRDSTQNLNIGSQSMARPYRVSAANQARFINTFPRSSTSDSYEFDESMEDSLFASQNERHSLTNGNSAQSSKSSPSPPAKHRNLNGAIPKQLLTKLNGYKPRGNSGAFGRSESEV